MHLYIFNVHSGVRQGGPLSPTLFNIFVDDCISDVHNTSAGCQIDHKYFGIIMYADDILLLAPAVAGLHKMLDKCTESFCKRSLEFNSNKMYLHSYWKSV